MKKITLLFLTFFAFHFGNAQQTISFETSEGYTIGDINGQNGWVATPITGGGNAANQNVSDAFASTGTNSFRIAKDPALATQSGPVIGGFYNYTAAVPYNNSVFSFDINISQQDSNTSDFVFGLVNTTAGSYVTYIRFSFNGNILVLSRDAADVVIQPDTNADWVPLTTYNVRIEIVGNTETFYLDNNQIYTGTLVTAASIEQVRFIHDNYDGFAYMDNFRTNDEATAGVDEFGSNVFTHSYNKNTDILTINSSTLAFDNIQMFNILGQEVLNKELSQTSESVSLAELQDGVYITKVTIEGQVKTVKLLKQ